MSRNHSTGNTSSSSFSRKRGRLDTSKPPTTTTTTIAAARRRNPNPDRRTASWGANSPSSSRSSSRNAPFSDFGSYMAEKNRKLREQFDASASGSGGARGIFHGVSIFVDGHTVPSNQELKGYMLKHGGRFENYFSKKRVTHIICSNLPDSKLKNLRSFSRGLPVVKPTWILESLAANKLLSWIPYQLDECVNETYKQQKLSVFFSSRKSSSSTDADSLVDITRKSKTGFISSNTRVPVEADGQQSKTKSEESEDSSHTMQGTSCEARSSSSNSIEKEIHEFHSLQSSPTRDSEQIVSESVSNQNSIGEEKTMRSPCSKQMHSTLNDPNFVKNYFKNSRLHFIGTWRSRYRKRFLDNSNEAVTNSTKIQGIPTLEKSAIIHIDMDCFFVSVILRDHPELIDKPVAVCHSDNPKGTAEISSANYPARQYGIRAGMFVREAKALCSNLVIFSYNFDAYEEVADQFYTILHKHCSRVQALSCDEAFLDVAYIDEDPQKVASIIRDEIAQTTGCTASAGIAENMLLARLATQSAKPNGQCFIQHEKVEDFLKNLQIQALPGIGYALEEKLKMHNIQTCGQLRLISKDILQKDFGPKTSEMLWSYCRGIDNRMVGSVQETKSVGAEVNWGVRFKDTKDCQNFLKDLCEEVSLRLQGCGMQGRTITLKVKKRREGADEPAKYMGCGDCINMSRSMTVPIPTDCAEFLQRISRQLFASFCVDAKEVRGVGLQISRLEHADVTKSGHAERNIESWLSTASKKSRGRPENGENNENWRAKLCLSLRKEPAIIDEGCQNCRKQETQNIDDFFAKYNISGAECSTSFGQSRDICGGSGISGMPPLSHLDIDVMRNLPSEIIAEFNCIYNGALSELLKSSAEKDVRGSGPSRSLSSTEASAFPPCKGNTFELDNVIEPGAHLVRSDSTHMVIQDKGKQPLVCSVPAIDISTGNVPANSFGEEPATPQLIYGRNSEEGSPEIKVSENKDGSSTFLGTTKGKWTERSDLIPCSLSQVDASVLQQLPEDLKADIVGALPAHSRAECSNIHSVPSESNLSVVRKGCQYHVVNLWEGDPPRWFHEFRASGCLTLGTFAEAFLHNGKNHHLSSLLQSLISPLPPFHLSEDEWDETFSGLSELFIQYIKSKIESDIEEVYVCFSLLKRFAKKSTFFSHIHDRLLPSVQDSREGRSTREQPYTDAPYSVYLNWFSPADAY